MVLVLLQAANKSFGLTFDFVAAAVAIDMEMLQPLSRPGKAIQVKLDSSSCQIFDVASPFDQRAVCEPPDCAGAAADADVITMIDK